VYSNVVGSGGNELDVIGAREVGVMGASHVIPLLCEAKAYVDPVDMPTWQKFLGKLFLERAEKPATVGMLVALNGVNGNVRGSFASLEKKDERVFIFDGRQLLSRAREAGEIATEDTIRLAVEKQFRRSTYGVEAAYYGGFLSVFGEGHDPDPAPLTGQLGHRWETTTIMVKSYSAMGGLHGAIDATRKLRAAHSIDPQHVSKIDITVGTTVYRHGWWKPERPLTAIGAQMNIGYVTAAALLDGNVLPEQFTPARLDADDIWSLIDRTDVHLDETLNNASADQRFRTDVAITMDDGTDYRARVVQPHGAPSDPLTNDDLVTKFHSLADRVTSTDRAAAIERAVLGLDDLDDVSTLVDLLAAPVAGALD
jgi:hypothetical protein